jgi:hypothetical protein
VETKVVERSEETAQKDAQTQISQTQKEDEARETEEGQVIEPS